ncbi:hypothetical protein Plec18167_006052 [Paecilomyces lecythidis]|uniref:Uncharacterized protein n=1 Tax=Paecilomyces lecythidis TaxID=3004212 RepID=A0ABR3XDT9_9EURO
MGLVKYILPALSAFAVYAIWSFSRDNGLFELIDKSILAKTLPGTKEPLRTIYSGVEAIDNMLTILGAFFWTVFDGSNPSLTLQAINFSGSFGAAWVLVVVESWRKANSWSIISFSSIDGALAQLATYAFATPLYFSFQSWLSPIVEAPSAQAIAVPPVVLNAIPLVFLIAYQVPSLSMILPTPDILSYDLKQVAVAAWQPWPIYVSILLTAIYVVLSPFTSKEKANSPVVLRRAFRRVYFFAFSLASISYVASVAVSVAATILPVLFTEKYAKALHHSAVFGLTFPWKSSTLRVQSVTEGVHIFLQWDWVIGSVGVLLWAISMYVSAHKKVLGRVGWVSLGLKLVNLALLAGPVAAAVELIWERDELLLDVAIKEEVIKEATQKALDSDSPAIPEKAKGRKGKN